MLARLSISMFAPRKTDKKVTAQVLAQNGAASDSGKFVKALLPEQCLEQIKSLAVEIRDFHYKHSLPWTDEGQRLLPSMHHEEYTKALRQFRSRWDGLVDDFIAHYESNKDAARATLGELWNEKDYPPVEKVVKKFCLKVDIDPIPSSKDFRINLADDEMAVLTADLDRRVAEAEQTAQTDLWRRLSEPIAHMVERLSDPKAIFRDTLVSNIEEITNLIPALNISGDPKLEALRLRAKEELCHWTPDNLRECKSVRQETAQKAADILSQMSGYLGMVEPPAATPQAIAA